MGKRDQGIHRAVQVHLAVNWRCERIGRYELAMTICRRIIPQVIKEVLLLEEGRMGVNVVVITALVE